MHMMMGGGGLRVERRVERIPVRRRCLVHCVFWKKFVRNEKKKGQNFPSKTMREFTGKMAAEELIQFLRALYSLNIFIDIRKLYLYSETYQPSMNCPIKHCFFLSLKR